MEDIVVVPDLLRMLEDRLQAQLAQQALEPMYNQLMFLPIIEISPSKKDHHHPHPTNTQIINIQISTPINTPLKADKNSQRKHLILDSMEDINNKEILEELEQELAMDLIKINKCKKLSWRVWVISTLKNRQLITETYLNNLKDSI